MLAWENVRWPGVLHWAELLLLLLLFIYLLVLYIGNSTVKDGAFKCSRGAETFCLKSNLWQDFATFMSGSNLYSSQTPQLMNAMLCGSCRMKLCCQTVTRAPECTNRKNLTPCRSREICVSAVSCCTMDLQVWLLKKHEYAPLKPLTCLKSHISKVIHLKIKLIAVFQTIYKRFLI